LHDRLIARDAWIIDGMKPGVLADRLKRADTAIFLDMPRRTCFRGLFGRRLAFRGRARPEIGTYVHIDAAQIRWIWRFPSEVRPVVLRHLEACSCNVVTLSSRSAVRRYLGTLPSLHVASPIGAHC
jgi:adenylate kinase family enzyme